MEAALVQGCTLARAKSIPSSNRCQNLTSLSDRKKLGLERSLGTRLVTYADDLVILCRKGKAVEALQRLREIMGKLKLTEACSAFTRIAARTLAPSPIHDSYPRASDISSPPCLPRLLPAGAVAGWASHPLGNAAFHGARGKRIFDQAT